MAASPTVAVSSTTISALSNTSSNSMIADSGDESDGWISSSTPRIVFLAVFIVLGLFGNLCLILTVCQSKKFRSITFFIFVINLAVINICECLLNMTVLLASSVINEWKFGKLPCRLSSFCLNLVGIATILALTISAADRLVAMRFKDKYEHVVSTPRIAILITFTWVQAVSFSFPIAIGCVPTSVNSYIVYCAISTGSSIVYNVANALLCFIVPLILMVTFFIKIIRTGYKDRFLIRNIISQHNYNEDVSQEPRIKQEIRHTNILGTLSVAWLILDGPHVVTSYFNQFKSSSELDDVAEEDLLYAWYIDLVLLWLRFSYSMALPIICFTWSKDLWKSFKDMILCRKNNAVTDESFKKGDSDSLKLERKIREEKLKEKESIMSPREQRVFQVPVLFATSHGVHIQTFEKDETATDDDEDDDHVETQRTSNTETLKGKKCDVIGSRDNLHFEDDTSDYDSGNEHDPFSVSHPISVKQLKDTLTDRKRSLSEPKVNGDMVETLSKNVRPNNNTVGSTSEGDSGLDLSTTLMSCKGKSKFHVPSDKLFLHNTSDKLQTEIMGTGTICPPRNTNDTLNDYAKFPTDKLEEKNQREIIDNPKNKDDIETFNQKSEVQSEHSIETIPRDSQQPPRRKKKKRKDKNFDTQSIASNSSIACIPPRPPPRLAPINATSSPQVSGSYNRCPESGRSSQCSMIDSSTDGRLSGLSCESYSDIHKSGNGFTKLDPIRHDNLSPPCLSTINRVTKHLDSTENSDIGLSKHSGFRKLIENNREINSVPEEVINAMSESDNDVNHGDIERLTTGSDLRAVEKSLSSTDTSIHRTEDEDQCNNPKGVKNSSARRKRREKAQATLEVLTNNTLLNENKGYQRLIPETP